MSWTGLASSGLLIVCLTGCRDQDTVTLKVFHAGSLSASFRDMERVFEAEHGGVDVQREAHGSAAAIRQMTELNRAADVIASADYRLIDQMMIEAPQRWADWNVLFARNSICIARSRSADKITQADWAEALVADGIRIGMSDPNLDPCGYRSLFCVYLSERLLGKEGLFGKLILANSNVCIVEEEDHALIRVPSDVTYRAPLVMRPKEVGLLALLEAGAIDYLFIYRSLAQQHGLEFLELPGEVDLSSPAHADQYASVRIEQYADLPARSVTVAGSPIVYGLTIPRMAPHPELADDFVRFVLSEAGRRIMEKNGQTALVPAAFSQASRIRQAPFDLEKLGD